MQHGAGPRKDGLDPLAAAAWGVLAAVTLLRLVAAARVPLTGDEAYYWEWSRHLAAGYVDHPPAVAYAIAAFAFLGRSPFAVRVAFILCGAAAAIAAGATAAYLAGGDRRAGAVTMLVVALTPMFEVAFGIATPDGPYLAAWAFTLYAAVRAFEERSLRWFAFLGAALGAALLSRLFSFALVLAIAAYALAPQRRWAWLRGLWLCALIAAALYMPFVLWNAQNGWISFAFALVQRHPADVEVGRPLMLQVLNALAYTPGLYLAAVLCAVRPRNALLAWSALPLAILLTVLAVHEPVEVYWFFGPYLSMSVAIGVAAARLSPRALRLWAWASLPPAVALSALVFTAVIAPGAVYAVARHAGLRLHDDGPFEIFTYPRLSRDVAAIAQNGGAIVMTDGYGFSSVLDFYGHLAPYVIGYDPQGEESRRWYDADAAVRRALFVDKAALIPRPGHPGDGPGRPDFLRQLHLACARVEPGPTLRYTYVPPGGVAVPERTYFTTWCDGMRTDGLATLQWLRPQRST